MRPDLPFRTEDASQWQVAVRDGNLLTGQPNFSGGETAQLIIETLGRS
jgi:putative intracellular protease/amidase